MKQMNKDEFQMLPKQTTNQISHTLLRKTQKKTEEKKKHQNQRAFAGSNQEHLRIHSLPTPQRPIKP
jgi:hypothetical protein